MAKHRKKQIKKAAIATGVTATALAVAFTPGVANALSSQTYFVGFPDWLPIGAGSTLNSDGNAVYSAIVGAKDNEPLVAWQPYGTSTGIDLAPVWVQWADPVLGTPRIVPDKTHDVVTTAPTDLYHSIYDTPYNTEKAKPQKAAYDAAYNATKAAFPGWQSTYNSIYNGSVFVVGSLAYHKRSTALGGCGNNDACAVPRAVASATSAADLFVKASEGIFKAAGDKAEADAKEAAGKAAGDAAIAQYIAAHGDTGLYATTTVTVVDTYKTVFDTHTVGQWVTPSDWQSLPALGQVAYLTKVLQGGSLDDIGALAPLINWTAYLTNVNIIAYGDGAIAAGVGYQEFIDSVKSGEYEVGDALTGPRVIKIVSPNAPVTANGTVSDPTKPVWPNPGEAPDFESVKDGGVLDVTLLSLILIRNPGTPNGGLYARFAPIYQDLTGVNPVTPKRQDVLPAGVDPELISKLLSGDASSVSLTDLGDLQAVLDAADGKPIVITLKAQIGWEYDLLSDAPATANPVAWANSVASSLFLTNLLTGLDFKNLGDGAYISPDGTLYYTIPVDDLPLLAPLRAPAQIAGLLTGNLDPATPVADAIEPFLKILVNTAYTDVQRNDDGTWTRGLDEFDVPTLFGTETLTKHEKSLVAGDLVAALGAGVGTQLSNVLVDAEKGLVSSLKLEVTDEQQKDIEAALTAPGANLKKVSRDLGDGVTKALTAVEPYLPDNSPTQEQLAKGQDAVGDVLVDVRDGVNKTVADTQNRNYQGQVALRESLAKVGIDVPKPPTPAERKAKTEAASAKASADLKKVGDDIKKAVNDTVDKVKKAVSAGG